MAEAHYAVHRDKPFFTGLVAFITTGPLVAVALEGPDAIAIVRTINGATRPGQAAPGTIRGDFALETAQNLVHASDGPETAVAGADALVPARGAPVLRPRHRPLGQRPRRGLIVGAPRRGGRVCCNGNSDGGSGPRAPATALPPSSVTARETTAGEALLRRCDR